MLPMKYGLWLLVLIALSSCNLETILKPLPEQAGAKGQELPAKSSSSVSSKRMALVIGNSAYAEEARLNGPVKDAVDMADVLKGLGFEVILKTDINLETMVDALRDFADRLSNNSVGLFYFSGHGNQYSGDNYLIPLRAKIGDGNDFQRQALKVSEVLQKMEENNKDGANLVFLDACRNNPYGGKGFKSGGANKGLIFTGSPKGSLIAYATAPGEIARDSRDAKQNSIYTKHLLAVLREMPRENILQLLTEVRMRVFKETENEFPQQVPREENSLMVKEFCLALEGCESTIVDESPPTLLMMEKRVALIIGNAAYTENPSNPSPLVNPVNDAKDMAEVLKGLGFDVMLKTDVKTTDDMVQAVQDFEERMSNKSVSLFYFSGHGSQYDGHNYLIPVQAQINDPRDFVRQALSASEVLEVMEDKNRNGVNLMFLDAAFYKPFGNWKGLSFGNPCNVELFNLTVSSQGSFIVNGHGGTAYETKGRNSLYTKHLLAVLRETPQENIFKLLNKVKQKAHEEECGLRDVQ